MKNRHRQHINPLKLTSLIPRQEKIFIPHFSPIEVELGCGDARFIIERAKQFPDTYFLGLDIRPEFLSKGKKKILQLKLNNISLQTANFIVDVNNLFPPEKIKRFFINFPDPWFKNRHKNRRWITPTSIDKIINCLEDSGEIFFQSDVWSISLDMLSILEMNNNVTNYCGDWKFLRTNLYQQASSRELSCIESNKQIWRLLFLKTIPYLET